MNCHLFSLGSLDIGFGHFHSSLDTTRPRTDFKCVCEFLQDVTVTPWSCHSRNTWMRISNCGGTRNQHQVHQKRCTPENYMEHNNDWNFPFFENYVSITSNLWIPLFSATFWEDVGFLNDRCIFTVTTSTLTWFFAMVLWVNIRYTWLQWIFWLLQHSYPQDFQIRHHRKKKTRKHTSRSMTN